MAHHRPLPVRTAAMDLADHLHTLPQPPDLGQLRRVWVARWTPPGQAELF